MRLFRRLLQPGRLFAPLLPGDAAPAFERLESRELLSVDLAISAGPVTNLFNKGQKSDTVVMSVLVKNEGNQGYQGGTLDFFLSPDNVLAGDDVRFASVKIPQIPAGGSKIVKLDVKEPKPISPVAPAFPINPGNYTVIVQARTASGETNTANNISSASGTVSIDYRFGDYENVTRNPLTVQFPNGNELTFRLDGPGVGGLENVNGNVVVTVFPDSRTTQLFITSSGKNKLTNLGGINVQGLLKSIAATGIRLDGFLSVEGGISGISLGGMSNASITIAATSDAFTFTRDISMDLGDVANSVITSDIPIRSLNVNKWVDSDQSPDRISAPYIGGLKAGGNFQSSLNLTAGNENNKSLGSASISGSISGGWILNRGTGSIKAGAVASTFTGSIRGPVEYFDVNNNFSGTLAVGNLGRLYVGGNMTGARVLVGASLGADLLLGGSGANGDIFTVGIITKLEIRGSMNSSIIATGLRSTDSFLLNADDTFVTGTSAIRSIIVRKGVSGNSVFVSPSMPTTAEISNKKVAIANNPLFRVALP